MNGIDWVKISQAIAAGIIPAPVGSDENNMPIWEIAGKSVAWQEIEKYIQIAQQPKPGTNSPEAIPSMPLSPEQYQFSESKVESNLARPEQANQNQQQGNNAPQVQAQNESFAKTSTAKGVVKLVGKSPVLQQVDLTDPDSMLDFTQAHINDDKDDSSKFLAEFLEKMLKILAVRAGN